jgi:hypothetical protein
MRALVERIVCVNVQVGFPNGRLRYATFSTPVGVWFHYVVAVQQSGSSCTLNVRLAPPVNFLSLRSCV